MLGRVRMMDRNEAVAELRKVLLHLPYHGLIFLLGHAGQVTGQREVHPLNLGQSTHHLSRANPRVQDEAVRERRSLLDQLLQLAKGSDAVHLYSAAHSLLGSCASCLTSAHRS